MKKTKTKKRKTPSWAELKELMSANFELIKENGIQMKENERKMKESFRETERMIKENAMETERKMKESSRETERMIKESSRETDLKLQATAKQIADANKLYGGFTNEFGKIIEDLCRPAALKIFRKEGIGIDHIYEGPRRAKSGEEEIEVDVLLCNKKAAVAVEVKTTCYKKDVDHYFKQMKKFKNIYHEFEGKTVYVAIAAIRFANGSDTYAQRMGLYVLSPLSDGLFSMKKPKNRKEF